MGQLADETLVDARAAFVAHYLENGFNATKAALDAGYAPKSAHAEGSRLLRDVKVVAAIKKALDENGIGDGRIDCEFAQMAMATDPADLNEMLAGGMTLTEIREAGFDTRQIKKIKVRREVTGKGDDAEVYEVVEVEMYDRLSALEKMGKVRAMFTDRHDHTSAGESLNGEPSQEQVDEYLEFLEYKIMKAKQAADD